ncbi:hypothetical protein GN956_G21315 [Arapaima gigas]
MDLLYLCSISKRLIPCLPERQRAVHAALKKPLKINSVLKCRCIKSTAAYALQGSARECKRHIGVPLRTAARSKQTEWRRTLGSDPATQRDRSIERETRADAHRFAGYSVMLVNGRTQHPLLVSLNKEIDEQGRSP